MSEFTQYEARHQQQRGSRKRYVAKINGRERAKVVYAIDHEEAAKRFLSRIGKEDMGTTKYTPRVRRDGVTDDGVHWWMGELVRRARDGGGWITGKYVAQFTTAQRS